MLCCMFSLCLTFERYTTGESLNVIVFPFTTLIEMGSSNPSFETKIINTEESIETVIPQVASVKCDEKCRFCNYFGRPDNVRAHVKSIHEKIRPICNGCAHSFATSSSLKRHLPKCKGSKLNEIVPESEIHTTEEQNLVAAPESKIDNPEGHLFVADTEMPVQGIENIGVLSIDDIVSVQHLITLRNGTTVAIPGEVEHGISLILNQGSAFASNDFSDLVLLTPPPDNGHLTFENSHEIHNKE